MLKRQFYILLFLSLFLNTFGQDSLNKFNLSGNKHGYWKAFLDKNLKPIDSINSYFIALIPYDNGKALITHYNLKWRSKDSIVYEKAIPNKGEPILLNGTFKWYSKKKKVMYCRESYSNGYPTIIQSYCTDVRDKRKSSDTIMYLEYNIDFSKRYDNKPGSFYYYYNPVINNNLREYWYKKVGSKWKFEEVKFDYSSIPIDEEIIGVWEIINAQKSKKKITFLQNNILIVNYFSPEKYTETYKYEFIGKDKIKLINGDNCYFLTLRIKNKRLILKYFMGNELYEKQFLRA